MITAIQQEKLNPCLEAVFFLTEDGLSVTLPETIVTAIANNGMGKARHPVCGGTETWLSFLPGRCTAPQPFPKEKVGKLKGTSPQHESQGHRTQPSFPEQVPGPVRKSAMGGAPQDSINPQHGCRPELCAWEPLGTQGWLLHLKMCILSKGSSQRKFQRLSAPNIFFSKCTPLQVSLSENNGEVPLVLRKKGGTAPALPKTLT